MRVPFPLQGPRLRGLASDGCVRGPAQARPLPAGERISFFFEPMSDVRLKNAVVLVLDDEALLRKRIAAFLERAGADVTQAGTVAEARRAAEATPYDFALLDVNLPDGRGTDLLAGKVFGAGTSVIVMTAEGGVETAVEAMRLGAGDYLSKPFDVAELPVRLERARRAGQRRRRHERQRAGRSVRSAVTRAGATRLGTLRNSRVSAGGRGRPRPRFWSSAHAGGRSGCSFPAHGAWLPPNLRG